MRLVKWYLDAVDDRGAGLIGYWAQLQSGPVRIRHAQLVRWPSPLDFASSPVQPWPGPAVHNSVAPGPPPQLEPDFKSVRWSCRGLLDLSMRCQSRLQGFASTLWSGPRGSIEWRCVAPVADVRVQAAGAEPFRGHGYAECLVLTIPPWLVPMNTLRWGRFIGGRSSMIWIDWRGPASNTTLRRIWVDGHLQPSVRTELSETHISDLDSLGWSLELHEGQLIRRGEVGSTALAAVRGLRRVAPAGLSRLLAAKEHKWISPATFRADPASPPVHGWAIHERVEFPPMTRGGSPCD